MFDPSIKCMLVLVLVASGVKSTERNISADTLQSLQMERDIAVEEREIGDLKHAVSKRSYSNPGNSYSHSTDSSLTWPGGLYWLPRPLSGCPTSATQTWTWGYFKVKTASKESLIHGIPNVDAVMFPDHVAGNKRPWYLQKICAKVSGMQGKEWPKGNYCIGMYAWHAGFYYSDSCPDDFNGGRMYFGYDQAEIFNIKSTVVDRFGITLYFCCRNDGSSTDMIELPRHEPFFLYGYKGECQLVKGMTVNTGFVKIAIRPGLNIFSSDYHPYTTVTRNGKIMLVRMCYYQLSKAHQGM